MKTNTWMKESGVKNEAKEVKAAECKSNVCGRTYDEETSFSQINFQTFQDILDKRNELLNSVKQH